MQKYIIAGLLLSSYSLKSNIRDIEKMMVGHFSPQYKYELVKQKSAERNIELWEEEVRTYHTMVDNALEHINKRRDILKGKVDYILSRDALVLEKRNIFSQIFFELIKFMRTFFRYEYQCNIIDAYNNLTSMKNRLEKSVKNTKRDELALFFKKQDIYLNKECSREDMPNELIQNKIIPYLNISNNIPVSQKDIVLSAYWSDGVYGWLESYPPQGGIVLGSESRKLHGQISNVLYNLPNKSMFY